MPSQESHRQQPSDTRRSGKQVRRLVDSLLNAVSRRGLLLIAVLGGAVPVCLWLDAGHTGYTALIWLAVYVPAAWLWLRDASAGKHARGDTARVNAANHADSGWALAMIYGLACGTPHLFFYAERDLVPHASMTLLAICMALASSAINLKKPASGVWLARASLGMALAGWGLAATADPLQFMVPLLAAWVFCEIVYRRSAYLKRKFAEAASRQYSAVYALRAKSQELQDTTSSRIRILSTVSHEIRQPVHALGMMVERLRIDPHSIEIRSQLDDIAAVVRSLAHSLALLLDISRLEAGTVKVKKSISDVRTIMDRIRREFAVDAKRKGLNLECTTSTNFKIDTDFALFYGAVANFVSNAIRYTDKGFVRVFVTEESGQVWLHVADSGRGIPENMKTEIFKEYVRLDRENQSAQGFGLGLAIVQRTARLLGLEIRVESRVGEGSEFMIMVPRTSDARSVAVRSTTMARPSTVSRALVGLRVVLVDNDESVLRGIDSMVRSWGCVPLACQSVAELEQKLARMPGAEFDCVVADYHLGTGDRNGLAAIEVLRRSMSRFVSATLFTGDLNIRPSDLPVEDVNVAYKPVVPARICVMFEEMAAETRRRRLEGASSTEDCPAESEFGEIPLADELALPPARTSTPAASAPSHARPQAGTRLPELTPAAPGRVDTGAPSCLIQPTPIVAARIASQPQ